MRILIGYNYFFDPVQRVQLHDWFTRLKEHGFQVDAFSLAVNPPALNYKWPQLEVAWKIGDRALYLMYERLATTLTDYDVFVNYHGVNLHPDFVRQLSTFNVFCCFDDPEASPDLSQPAAWAYDLSLVGNIAAVELYAGWGVKHARFLPLGYRATDHHPALTREQILHGERDVDVALLCSRFDNDLRSERLDRFAAAFPQGAYYGMNWPNGFLPEEQRIPLYQRTKIGVNFHLSTGPINYRTYTLPANGVMQLCDNKSHLGKIFTLEKEVVGFDTVEEAIDLCRYYLDHDEERRAIAAAGWARALKEYNEIAVMQRLIGYVEEFRAQTQKTRFPDEALHIAQTLRQRRSAATFHRTQYHVKHCIQQSLLQLTNTGKSMLYILKRMVKRLFSRTIQHKTRMIL